MTLRMADAIYPQNLPPGLDAYAGYDSGNWPDFPAIAAAHPSGRLLEITPSLANRGQCLDIEAGDARPQDAPTYIKWRIASGVVLPKIYFSVSLMPEVLGYCNAAGIPRSSYKVWTAHYGAGQHICNGADGTQWIDWGGWDESLLLDNFFGPVAVHADPAPVAPPLVCLPVDTAWKDITNAMQLLVQAPTDAQGNAWAQTAVPWNQYVAVAAHGGYPPRDGYVPATVGVVDEGEQVCIQWTGCKPGTIVGAILTYAGT